MTRPLERTRSQSAWGRLLSDLNALYRAHLRMRARGGAQVGAKTRRERRFVLERALRDLHGMGFELRRLKNFRGRHVRAILAEWKRRELAPATYATNVSHLRTLCRWIGKPELIRLIDEAMAQAPQLTQRRAATDRDRSLEGAGVDSDALLHRACELDLRFCCQLALIPAFGLRSLEAWLFRPHLALDDVGRVRIDWGTKGGRPRTLRLPASVEQRAVIEWAKTFALTPAESMIPRGWRIERWRGRYYRLCARVGLTKRGLGVTPHALRHGFLLAVYHRLTGCAAPARGGDLAARDPDADRAARRLVAEDAGHARLSISSAYLGPMRVKPPAEAAPQDSASTPAETPDPSRGKAAGVGVPSAKRTRE
jgi:integrase